MRPPDPVWHLLLGVGGVCAWIFVLLLVVAIVLSVTTPAPPIDGGAATLAYIAGHRTLYVVHQELWLVPGAFAAVTYLALYPALRRVDQSLATLGTAVGGAAWALTLAVPTTSTGAPALVYLSDQAALTLDPARKAALAAAAETLIAQNRTPSAVGVLTTVGMLLVSVAMAKGGFPRWVAYLGIATGALGIVSEVLRPVIEGGYAVYGILLLVWTGAVGWCLLSLARARTIHEPGGLSALR
ncbi:hypothetical protein N865_05300 [Intrasporangium oryzae NRRL B-24470]|uniref:DUF4386 family protein n=1 Tax=Intrasporangium oryzae NRRL B-24470 TaxID=1386089 RepID=W9GFA0_9MICO|nr:DUF4386 family protein [Intrasporangium oryzae]EWT02519.1 hypothetical protein N865_05300 [Intrasporangium oryzae NRRL B-24470]